METKNLKEGLLSFIVGVLIGLLFGLVGLGITKYLEHRPFIKPVPVLAYSQDKTMLLDSLLSVKPNDKTLNYSNVEKTKSYCFTWDTCRLIAIHYLAIPYVRNDYWAFLCNTKSGKDILIQEQSLCAENLLSPALYKRIKEYCLNNK